MSDASSVVLSVFVAILAGLAVSLITGILAWIRDSKVPTRERVASAILQGGAAWAATILLVVAVFATIGVLR